MYTIQGYNMADYPSRTARLKGTPDALQIEWVGLAFPFASLRLKVENVTKYTHFKLSVDGVDYVFKVNSFNTIGALAEYSLEIDYLKTFFSTSRASSAYEYVVKRSSDSDIWSKYIPDPEFPSDGTVTTSEVASVDVYIDAQIVPIALANSECYNRGEDTPIYSYKGFKSLSSFVFTGSSFTDAFLYICALHEDSELIHSAAYSFYYGLYDIVGTPGEPSGYKYFKSGQVLPRELESVYGRIVTEDYTIVKNLVTNDIITDFRDLEPYSKYYLYVPLLNIFYPVRSSLINQPGTLQLRYITHYASQSFEVWLCNNNPSSSTPTKKLEKIGDGAFPVCSVMFSDYAKTMDGLMATNIVGMASSLASGAVSAPATGGMSLVGSAMSVATQGANLAINIDQLNKEGAHASGGASGGGIFSNPTASLYKVKCNHSNMSIDKYREHMGVLVNKSLTRDAFVDGKRYIMDGIEDLKGPEWLVNGINRELQDGFIY